MSSEKSFKELLMEQVGNEFAAQQQYIAMAVWFDQQDLPALAQAFYTHSVDERNHAMMMIQYMIDRDIPVVIPPLPEVTASFESPVAALEFALQQEKDVTDQIKALFAAARAETDPLGEQFMLWFLSEQVEEVANMDTLVTVAERSGQDWFKIEQFLHRGVSTKSKNTATAPAAAGGAL